MPRADRRGVTCLDCHMPTVDAPSVAGGRTRWRRSHRFAADKDADMLQSALHASITITGRKGIVSSCRPPAPR